MMVGGAAPPRSMIEAVLQAPRSGHHARLGDDGDEPARHALRAPRSCGSADAEGCTRVVPSKALRCRSWRSARAANRHSPVGRRHDGRARSSRAVVASAYTSRTGRGSLDRRRLVQDGRRRDHRPRGYVEVQDRAKDLVKSGGEWISTVELENALMGHPAVAEAAVIAVPAEVVGATARGRRAARGPRRDARRAARVPRAELREVVAPRPVRVRRRDSEDSRRQVPQDRSS